MSLVVEKMFINMIKVSIVVLLMSQGLSASEPSGSLNLVRDTCNKKVDLKSIKEFSQFLEHLKRLVPEEISLNGKDESLKKCLDDRGSFLALGELIDNYDKERPCKMSEIAKLEQYARKFLSTSYRPASLKFFILFGVNVGYHCRLNLLAHVKQADSEADPLDFIYSMASPTGWTVLINEHTKKSMKFGASAHAANSVVNRLAKLVPGFNQIEQLEYLNFEHFRNELNDRPGWNGYEEGFFVLSDRDAAAKLAESLARIVDSCRNLDSLYVNSILSLARLAHLGMLVDLKEVSQLHESSLMLHKWLAASSFCQLMSRVKSEPSAEGIRLQVLHRDDLLEHRRRLYSYAAPFEEIVPAAAESVWLASVSDGRWRQKEAAMFRSGKDSAAMRQLRQFIRGLERDQQLQQGSD